MKTRFLGLAAAMLVAGTLAPGAASAANSVSMSALTCSAAMRMPESIATCLYSQHDNSGTGSIFAAHNYCHDYGTMKVHVDLINATDAHFTLDSSGLYWATADAGDVRAITCCVTASDLCIKNQVEADSTGKILHKTVVGSFVTDNYVYVDTHQRRYDFCQRNPDYIYCTVNPSGDAHRNPADAECGTDSTPRCNCNDHFCTVGDCDWHWKRAPASDTCANPDILRRDYSMSISATDGTSQTCSMTTICLTGRVREDGVHAEYAEDLTWTDQVGNMDDLRNCGGELKKVDACPNDNEVILGVYFYD